MREDRENEDGSIERDCIEKRCGSTFIITAGEREYFDQLALHLPKRCKPCRERRKAEKG